MASDVRSQGRGRPAKNSSQPSLERPGGEWVAARVLTHAAVPAEFRGPFELAPPDLGKWPSQIEELTSQPRTGELSWLARVETADPGPMSDYRWRGGPGGRAAPWPRWCR